jgi:predicted dehydrogenase
VRPAAHVAGEEVATVLLGYPDRVAQLYLSWASIGAPEDVVHPDTAIIEGTEGTLAIGPDGHVRIQYRDGRTRDEPVDTVDAYQRSWTAALAHFADCLVRDRPFETSGEDNLRTLRLVFAAYASAASGQSVSVQ